VPSRHSLREESDPTARAPFSPSTPYPPNLVEDKFCELRHNGVLGSSYLALCIAPVLCPNSATVAGVSFGVSRPFRC
jgi:hypothetical protein